MKLFYFQGDKPNFGDDLNPWLWNRLLPNFFDDDESEIFVGIGTILNAQLPPADKYTVFGSGYGYSELPRINDNWNIISVRGKYTCDKVGLPTSKAIIDPAYLLKTIFKNNLEKKYQLSIIPHAESMDIADWHQVAKKLNAHLIDTQTTDVESFVTQVRQSKYILCEAMHGAIIADCFEVPWAAYYASEFINHEKWNDWLSVFNQEVALQKIPELEYGHGVLRRCKNILKRILIKIPIWKKDWALPHNNAKTVANALLELHNSNSYFCNKPSEVDDKVNLLLNEVETLKANQ